MSIFEEIKKALSEIEGRIIATEKDLQEFKREILGKKGIIQKFYGYFRDLKPEERASFGKELNKLKSLAEKKYKEAAVKFAEAKELKKPRDLTLPVFYELGGIHPLEFVENKVVEIFRNIGFVVEDGGEIEDDWHNFTALNFPAEHPARDMQDTFFLDKEQEWLLRTHTSSVQVRVMEKKSPPLRILAIGRVYRNEDISARSHNFFHQIEGLVIDKTATFSELKSVLYLFARRMFGEQVQVKFRPSYFPFTEISAEMDITCLICEGKGCGVCKHTGWVEILGCGMVDPNVLENCNIDSSEYQGYAFGMGVERIAQLLFRVPDIRFYSQNAYGFLNQFKTLI